MTILEQYKQQADKDFKELWEAWEKLKESLKKTNELINNNKNKKE